LRCAGAAWLTQGVWVHDAVAVVEPKKFTSNCSPDTAELQAPSGPSSTDPEGCPLGEKMETQFSSPLQFQCMNQSPPPGASENEPEPPLDCLTNEFEINVLPFKVAVPEKLKLESKLSV
jgi:hypothetical protein